jgi:hypothetical protein
MKMVSTVYFDESRASVSPEGSTKFSRPAMRLAYGESKQALVVQ